MLRSSTGIGSTGGTVFPETNARLPLVGELYAGSFIGSAQPGLDNVRRKAVLCLGHAGNRDRGSFGRRMLRPAKQQARSTCLFVGDPERLHVTNLSLKRLLPQPHARLFTTLGGEFDLACHALRSTFARG